MDISAIYTGKGGRGKGNKGYKGKQQGKGYKGKGQGYGYNNDYGNKRKTSVATGERNRQRTRKE